MADADQAADWEGALNRARAHAPFLARGLERLPDIAALLDEGRGEEALMLAKQAGEGVTDTAIALRREKLALAVTLAVGDLAGAFTLDRVMHELSAFADRALDRAITAAILRRVPDAQPAGFFALALGKHGARELNYSSDIDPILLYDAETLPRRSRDEPGEAAQRYARDIVQMLSQNTAEGYVFRVDLRLRPASEVSPLAISTAAALVHYESSALAWERAAFIRARSCAGEIAAGRDFLSAIDGFIWRRSLDFGAIDAIRRLTLRIRAGHDGPRVPGPSYSVKHGRGGIREVEFFAQTHQLVHGGRDPTLRLRGTRPALDALAAAGRIAAEEAGALGEAYDRLRTVEHRLQMVEDQQTHELPGGAALDNVARLDGLADGEALVAGLTQTTEQVGLRFDALIEEDTPAASSVAGSAGALAVRLGALGFDEPAALASRIEGWSDGRYRALRSEEARQAFDDVLPDLLAALAEAPEPDRAILRWEKVLAAVPSAINLFRLLGARPALLSQLIAILSLAPPLADVLGRRPELLDTLIDRSAFDLPGGVGALAARMAARPMALGSDYEDVLDRIRVVTGETRFMLGVQLIEAAHDPLKIAAALSHTAEAAIRVAVSAAETVFIQKHGTVPGAELVVLGLGRLGGGYLTHASDLDIVYLFSGSHSGESDGPRPLGATLYFNRLAQRVSAALSVPTAQGALYEVDTRLRPQGNQGPLAVSMESFARYQREQAWTWEHMALTRARPLAGSREARRNLKSLIGEILSAPRKEADLKDAVLAMRADMAAHKKPQGILDTKLLRGGLVDLEFIVHFLQLREQTAFTPHLPQAIAQLAAAGLPTGALADAEGFMTRLLVAARLVAPDLSCPPGAAQAVLARACGSADFAALLKEFAAMRRIVADCWRAVFDVELEVEE
ncbi:bifunctional [glutamine synthetase] adenylyltransferase/[glutamine synthetase]-adenylyl-L-tyrosine phosphorylase [Pseudopontixanthobacter vadosimaris]|uniref:bifunctional [glutamine synthetase] adenylyltransferase/[glutamine synthetase]-adenylyl-L-tyrosine phosphorylase n=1 Tax=Pseudopontixanthobacter vadosimaris TaxID=2726450 RepID=UPI0014766CAC|nr:bifunctional [glutamine synthetase] adenylyltransferase/[glutamine synthetase]-adenylyl-L-tyrosine phosphorylase [Pseudopontixanthobacter vadosimaris]